MEISNGCYVKTGLCDQINFGNLGLKIRSFSTAGLLRARILTEAPRIVQCFANVNSPGTSKKQCPINRCPQIFISLYEKNQSKVYSKEESHFYLWQVLRHLFMSVHTSFLDAVYSQIFLGI